MATKRLFLLVLAVVGSGILDGCASSTWEKSKRPNVVLISIDTLRADHLRCYGHPRMTSPEIDALARENTVFRNHMATMATTVPSHASMLTGLHPRTHGSMRNGAGLADSFVTLPEILHEEGYLSAAFVSAGVLASRTNVGQGFGCFTMIGGKRRAERLVREAGGWISLHRAAPFFLFAHFWEPHSPYNPPEEFNDWKGVKHGKYDGEILYVDYAVGRLIETLRDNGLYDDTLILVTSDHGEGLGDHGCWGHGKHLYDSAIRVPLIIHRPGQSGYEEVWRPTSHIDLLPTILDALGLKPGPMCSGVSLFNSRELEAREVVFAQRREYPRQDEPIKEIDPKVNFDYGEKYMARGLRYKFVYRTRYPDELYDVQEDPGETNNLLETPTQEHKDVARRYRQQVEDWLNQTPLFGETELLMSEEHLDYLRSLGYTE